MSYVKDCNGTPQLVDEETGEILAEAFWKTPYNHDRNVESDRTGCRCEDVSKTDQSFKDDADINTIIERIKKTGEVNIPLPEHFGDARAIPTLFDARMRIAESNAVFYNLDADVRAEFLNDPARWERQVSADLNAGNLENLRRMGIDPDNVLVRAPAEPPRTSPAYGAPETTQEPPEPSKTP